MFFSFSTSLIVSCFVRGVLHTLGLFVLIHPTAGKGLSANFARIGFSEVRRCEERGATRHKKRAGLLIPARDDVAF
jgi:hypothetical protein